MKKACLTGVIFVFVSLAYNVLMAQQVDQLKMMEKYIGKWQANRGKDTVEVWDYKPYGSQAYIVEIYHIVKGKNIPVSFNPFCYNPSTGNFYGFTILYGGYYGTWIGSFSSESRFDGDMLQDLNPQMAFGKIENIFKNPNEWHGRSYTNSGITFMDLHFTKVR